MQDRQAQLLANRQARRQGPMGPAGPLSARLTLRVTAVVHKVGPDRGFRLDCRAPGRGCISCSARLPCSQLDLHSLLQPRLASLAQLVGWLGAWLLVLLIETVGFGAWGRLVSGGAPLPKPSE